MPPLLQSSGVPHLHPGPASFFIQSESCHIGAFFNALSPRDLGNAVFDEQWRLAYSFQGPPDGGWRMVARDVLVAFERVVDDWAERGPAGERRRAATERAGAHRNMGKIAAGLWASFVDHAKIAV